MKLKYNTGLDTKWTHHSKLDICPYGKLSMKMVVRGDGFANNIMSNLYIYIYNNRWNWEKFKLEFQIRVQFCVMCPKLFIIKEFYFLILESNMKPHHKYSSKWVIKYKN